MAFRAAGTPQVGNGSSIPAIGLPAGLASGDLMLCFVGGDDNQATIITGGTLFTSGLWTKQVDVTIGSPDGQTFEVWSRVAGASEVAPTAALVAGMDYEAFIACWSGRTGTFTVGTVDNNTASNSIPFTVGSTALTVTAGSDVCFAYALDPVGGSATWANTAPSGYTNRVTPNSSNASPVGITTLDNASSGSQNPTTAFTAGGNAGWMSVVISMPGSGGGGGGTAALTAASSTAGVGASLGKGIDKALAGNTTTASVTSAAPGVTLALTGVTVTTSTGTVSSGPPILGPVSSAASAGTVSTGAAVPIAGVQGTITVASLGAGPALALTAVSAATGLGSLQRSVDKPLTGAIATGAVGTAHTGTAIALAGVASTTTVSAAGVSVTVALSGVSSTTSVGSVRAPALYLTPNTATGSAGTVTPGASHAVSGVSGTTSVTHAIATPTSPLSAVQGTGSVGSVTFGHVVVALAGNTVHCSAGNLALPNPPDFKNGELFMAIQSGAPPFYVGGRPAPNQRGAILYATGSWQVPAGATNVFLSATAGGGSPFGLAGQQLLHQWLDVNPGDVISVTFDSPGNINVAVGGTQLLYLHGGPPYKKHAWQSTFGQASGIAGFGSGVDAGTPFPPILVFYWN